MKKHPPVTKETQFLSIFFVTTKHGSSSVNLTAVRAQCGKVFSR